MHPGKACLACHAKSVDAPRYLVAVWVGNFGPLRPGNIFSGRLTQLAGAGIEKID